MRRVMKKKIGLNYHVCNNLASEAKNVTSIFSYITQIIQQNLSKKDRAVNHFD